MSKHPLKLAIGLTLALYGTVAAALPFSFLDPRSMAMGGAGVAIADAAAAPLFNPALLSVGRYADDFSITLPTVGARVADERDLIGSVDKFQTGDYVNILQNSINTLNTNISTATATPTAGNIAAVSTSAATVATNLNSLSAALDTLNNKPLTFDAGASTVIGLPNKKFGIAFFANGSIASGATFQYRDAALLGNLSTQASCISTAAANPDPVAAAAAISACGTPVFDNNSLQSTVNLRGIKLGEAGFAISREFGISRHERLAFGITPKLIHATLYDIPLGINSPSLSNFNTTDYQAQYHIPNFDLGVARNFRDGWRAGLAVKNVIPYFLDFKRAPTPGAVPVASGETLRLVPQTRAGVSYTNSWSAVALDMDLYRNDPAGLENYTQYISMGAELNARYFGQLRAGWRVDLVNSARNVVGFGIGFSPFGALHADLGIAGNEHELAAALQLGLRF